MRFLGFRIYAPLCSFGDVAVGEHRPSLGAPTRSMVLGLVASCLGIPRHDADGQAELERSLGVATRTDAEGTLLVDYHTAQAPDSTRLVAFRKRTGFPVATRRDEVNAVFDKDGNPRVLDTQLSQRQYRTDAAFAVCVWLRVEPARWTLDAIADRMRQPIFAPFVGRKAAPMGTLFEPTVIETTDPVAAVRDLRFSLDEAIARVTRAARHRTFRWEGDWKGVKPDRTETRRDRVHSRERWQFHVRDEHVLTEAKEEGDVSQPHRAGA